MAKITTDDVLHLAELSNLQLTKEEITNLRGDIENILGYIEQLQQLDVSALEPTYQVTDLENVMREDEIIDYNISREQLLELAPDRTQDSVKVPKVLEQ